MKKNIFALKSKIFIISLGFLFAAFSITVRAQYTLTDNDVVVTNGIITSCSYTFAIKNIIIPQTLDGQTVVGIANASYPSAGVFNYKGITSVQLPASIKTIGDYAFYSDNITNLNLSGCTALTAIGRYAFSYNAIATLNLSNCASLATIGESAFYSNKLTNLNLSSCSSLTSIGQYAFSGNSSLTGFILPEVTYKGTVYKTWLDGTGKTYTADVDQATNFSTFYQPFIPYTLTDDDVVVEGGIIKSCSYSFELKNIIVPQTLDGQTVTGTASGSYGSAGVFYKKGIISVQMPSTMKTIGDYSFYDNAITRLTFSGSAVLTSIGKYAFYLNDLTNLDLSNFTVLTTIGDDAFYDNSIVNLNLTGCTALTTIGGYAFYSNNITNLNLSDCTKLSAIGNFAFYFNTIASLNLTNCNALITIGEYAFYSNKLTSLNLSSCSSLNLIGQYAFSGNSSLTGFGLPEVTYKGTVYKTWLDGTGKNYTAGVDQATNFNTSYLPLIPYTLTDDDVVVEGGIIKSCSYSFELKNIIIPQTLDGQTVTGTASGTYSSAGVFYNKGIASLQLPATMKTIGDYAFYDNAITRLTFSGSGVLTSIGKYAFYLNDLTNLDLSNYTALTIIGDDAFYNNSITNLNLSGCTALNTIGDYAFYSNSITNLNLSGCTKLTTIGKYAFYFNAIASLNITNCTLLTTIGDYALSNNKLTNLDLSSFGSLTSIGQYSFSYNTITSLNLTGCNSLLSISSGAFTGNSSLKGFALPEVTYKGTVYKTWQDGTGKSYNAGTDQVTNFNTFYYPLIYYTLTNDDVVVEKGIIKSCSYSFELRNIIIPQTLDGQTVTGIAKGSYSSAGVFYSKGIISLQLPSTIQTIGDYAFYDNPMTKLNLSGCDTLSSIGNYAFYSCDLASLDLSDCTALTNIGNSAFYGNKLSGLTLTACKKLTTIGKSAFGSNSLTGFILPDPSYSGYILNRWFDDSGGSYNSGSQVNNLSTGYSARMTQFYKDNFFAVSLPNSQPVNIRMNLKCPPRGFEVSNLTFDDVKFTLNTVLPVIVPQGDSAFSLQVKLANPETKLFTPRLNMNYKIDGQIKTYSDNLHIAVLMESNTELGIVGKRAITAYNSSADSNQVASQNNQGVIYRLLGYPDLAKSVFNNAVNLALSKFYGFTGVKMN